jgi:hypothetical protein
MSVWARVACVARRRRGGRAAGHAYDGVVSSEEVSMTFSPDAAVVHETRLLSKSGTA